LLPESTVALRVSRLSQGASRSAAFPHRRATWSRSATGRAHYLSLR